jgi:hypothetical protein
MLGPVPSSTVITDTPTPRPDGPRRSPLADRLRQVSLWSVAVGVVVFLVAFGLEPWVVAVAVFGLLWAAVSRVVTQRVEEIFERRPALRLVFGDLRTARQTWRSFPR